MPTRISHVDPVIVTKIPSLLNEIAFMGVREQFCGGGGGGLRPLAEIFSPLLARKSNGFARLWHFFGCRKWPLEKNPRGCRRPPPPPPCTPMIPTSHSILRKWSQVVLTERLYVTVWPWHYVSYCRGGESLLISYLYIFRVTDGHSANLLLITFCYG